MVSITIKFRGKVLVDTPGAILFFHQEYRRAFGEGLAILRNMVRARTPIGAWGRLYKSISYTLQDLTPGGPQGRPSAPIEFKGTVFSSSGVPPTPWSWVTGAAVVFGPAALALAPLLTRPAYMACTYGPAVESGTRPHWPPLDVISTWASHVLNLSGPEADLAAFFIGRNISKVGTRGQRMFERGRQAFMASGVMERKLREAGERAKRAATAADEMAEEVPEEVPEEGGYYPEWPGVVPPSEEVPESEWKYK